MRYLMLLLPFVLAGCAYSYPVGYGYGYSYPEYAPGYGYYSQTPVVALNTRTVELATRPCSTIPRIAARRSSSKHARPCQGTRCRIIQRTARSLPGTSEARHGWSDTHDLVSVFSLKNRGGNIFIPDRWRLLIQPQPYA